MSGNSGLYHPRSDRCRGEMAPRTGYRETAIVRKSWRRAHSRRTDPTRKNNWAKAEQQQSLLPPTNALQKPREGLQF